MKVWSGSVWVSYNPAISYLPLSGGTMTGAITFTAGQTITGYLPTTGGTMTGAITFAAGQFGTNVNTFLSTPSSANLAAALTDETGSGAAVFANTPTLIAPILGTPASGTLTNCTFPTLNQNTTGTAATATNVAGGSAGTIPYQTASGTTAMLAAGTATYVLTSNGTSAPTWAAASGGGTATGASYTNPTAAGTSAAAFGSGASASGGNALALGKSASAAGTSSIAIGGNGTSFASATGVGAIAIGGGYGTNATAVGQGSIAIGDGNSTGTHWQAAIGYNSNGLGSVTALGQGAMALGGSYASGTDSFAAAIGDNTSSYGATGANSVAIGNLSLASGARSTALGYGATVTTADQIQLGNSSSTTYVYGTVQNRSDKRDKSDIRNTVLGLDFINKLRPVDYKWDFREDYKDNISDGTKKRSRYHHGLIAQEVESIIKETGVDFGGFQNHAINAGDDILSIGYDELIAPLIKAVQELSAEFNEYKRKHPSTTK
jgi:hypothetical protein